MARRPRHRGLPDHRRGTARPTSATPTRWATNIGRNGLIVNGDNVTATGLFVEHFQEYNTIWNGENGRVLLYQNELPYDPPTQADWTQPDGTLGWAGYKVADDVKTHQLWGGGVYVFNRNDPSIVTENGYEVPDTPGVVLTHVMTKNLSGPGTINAVVNGFGDKVDGISGHPADPDDYEDPELRDQLQQRSRGPSLRLTPNTAHTAGPHPFTGVRASGISERRSRSGLDRLRDNCAFRGPEGGVESVARCAVLESLTDERTEVARIGGCSLQGDTA